jgi:GNAT superfamily N-acetyltransferase
MEIRPAALADVGAVASLVARYWEFESIAGFDRPQVEAFLTRLLLAPERGACWVAATEGGLCAYLIAVYMLSLEHGGLMAEIDEIFVSPEMRSLGMGTRLLQHAERDLAQRGLVRLQLQLGVGNHRGRMFYERHGFHGRAGYELLDKPLRPR